ncbi:MAG: hypothetical protein ACKVOK_03580 [Flavobacteriales bacterium]
MKNQNMHIPDEDHIPEGLEFREEYMQSALSMYDRARKGLLFKKWIFGSLGVVVVAFASMIFYSNSGESKTELTNRTTIVQTENQIAPVEPTLIDNEELATNSHSEKTGEESSKTKLNDNTSSSLPDDIIQNPGDNINTGDSKKIPTPSYSLAQNKNPTTAVIQNTEQSISEKSAVLLEETSTHFETPQSVSNYSATNANSTVFENEQLNSTQNHVAVSEAIVENIRIKPLPMRYSTFTFDEERIAEPRTPRLPATSKWVPYFTLGLNPLTKYGLDYTQPQLNPALNLGIRYKVCSGATLSAAVEYFSITGLLHPYSIWNSDYGQGSVKSQTIVYTNTLHYCGLHFQSILPVANRHALLVGYRMSYLINGQNEISTSTTQNSESLPESNTQTKGYILGFRNLNHSLTAGYEYRLGGNKYIGINYSFGLSDITRDDYFGPVFDRNSMLGIYLKMNLK